MSLIKARRNRKKNWMDSRKGKSPRTLILLLLVVVGIIWYLSYRF